MGESSWGTASPPGPDLCIVAAAILPALLLISITLLITVILQQPERCAQLCAVSTNSLSFCMHVTASLCTKQAMRTLQA
jgi:hypothetical protein